MTAKDRAYLSLLCEMVFNCPIEQYEHETGQPLTLGALREEMEWSDTPDEPEST